MSHTEAIGHSAPVDHNGAPPGRRPADAVRRRFGGPRAAAAVAIVVTLAAVLFLWQNVGHDTEIYASKPSKVVAALHVWLTDPTLRGYIPVTLEEAGLGLVLGLFAAVVLAVPLASSRVALEVVSPYLAVANAIPKIALAPLFLVIFGLDMRSKVYFVAAAIFFIPFQGLIRALTSIDPVIKDNARMLGAGRLAMARDVHLPAVVGSMTASLRITAAFALLATVVAELVSSTEGLGYEISHAQQNSQPDFIIAGILLIGLIGVIVDRLLLYAERLLSRWQVDR